MLSRFSHVQLFVILWAIACQVPWPTGFSKQEYWHGLPCFLPGDLPGPRIKPVSCASPALAEEFFTTSATWAALVFTGNLYVFTWLQLSVHSWLVQEQIQVQQRFSFRVFKIFRLCGDRYYKMKNWRHASIRVLLKGNKLEERQKMKYTSGQKCNWKTKTDLMASQFLIQCGFHLFAYFSVLYLLMLGKAEVRRRMEWQRMR